MKSLQPLRIGNAAKAACPRKFSFFFSVVSKCIAISGKAGGRGHVTMNQCAHQLN
jgi:hypothetical protein